MPTYEITAPDGKRFRVSGDGTADEALAHFQSQYKPPVTAADLRAKNPGEYDPQSSQFQARLGPTSAATTTDNLRAGAGKAFMDLGRGVGQTVGLESRQAVAQSRAQDAPLMATTAGKVGNVAGNVAATLPALAIPGANTVVGAGVIGAGLGFLQPSASTQETLTNTGLGAATGAAGQYVGNKVASAVGSKLASRSAAATEQESLNSARDAVLTESRKAGYVVPPTAVNPSATATALESISGKAATRQAADAINAKATNKLVAGDLGLATNKPITQQALAAVREEAGRVYKDIAASGQIAADDAYLNALAKVEGIGADLEKAYPGLGAQANGQIKQLVTALTQPETDARQAVSAFKFLNERAKANFKMAFGPSGGNSQALELARAQKAAADAVGDLIQRNLGNAGNQALADSWQAARTTIAKSYAAEAALKGGNVSALRLAQQLRKGAPLSGGFKTAAEFGDMFADVAKLPKSGAGVSKLAAVVGAGGALEALAMGHPGIAAGAVAGAATPWAVRQGLLSRGGQNLLAMPNYAPGRLGTGTLNALGTVGRYGTLPAYLSTSELAQAQQQEPPQ